MAFTMHSHSGQFCPGHAKDQLEDIVKYAISIGFKTMGLTEHMPRTELVDLYPEELTPDPHASLSALMPRHEAYLAEASRLQAKYARQIHVLIGFEGEFIRPATQALVMQLAAPACIDYFLGSLHHAAGVPIDVDSTLYAAARDACGGSDDSLWSRYYDDQLAMLHALRPRIVAHFDLVRLLADAPGRCVRTWADGTVWARIVRNLTFVRGYGGWLECNTSALRKGLAEPYPEKAIAEKWLELGGRFTFSDDSHSIAQVATNYVRGLDYLENLGVGEVWTLERQYHPGTAGDVKAPLVERSVSLVEFRASLKLDKSEDASCSQSREDGDQASRMPNIAS